MLDSGSAVTLVRADLAGPLSSDTVPVTCVHGDVRDYLITTVRLQTPRGNTIVPAGAVPKLPVPFLLGYDCPLFERYWQPGLRKGPPHGKRRPRHQHPRSHPRAACPIFGEVEPGAPSDSEPPSSAHGNVEGPAIEEGEDAQDEPRGGPPFSEPPDPFAEFPKADDSPTPGRGDFASLQWEDPNLKAAREQVSAIDG